MASLVDECHLSSEFTSQQAAMPTLLPATRRKRAVACLLVTPAPLAKRSMCRATFCGSKVGISTSPKLRGVRPAKRNMGYHPSRQGSVMANGLYWCERTNEQQYLTCYALAPVQQAIQTMWLLVLPPTCEPAGLCGDAGVRASATERRKRKLERKQQLASSHVMYVSC